MKNENLNREEYFLFKNSYTSGPFTIEKIKEMAQENVINDNDLIWCEGMKDWEKYADRFNRHLKKDDNSNNNKNNQPTQIIQDPPKFNYFLRHWRGDISLGWTYWINVVLVSIVLKVSQIIVQPLADTFNPVTASLYNIIWCLFTLLVACWQIVGLWRSASKYRIRGGSEIWSGLAKFVSILGAISSASLFINNIIPSTSESLSILTGDRGLPPFKITVLPGGNDIEFRGGIRTGSSKELEKILTSVPLAKVLHIESSGGRVYEAVEMAKTVKEKNMTTYTSRNCQSAATIILLAGKERVIAVDAKVGFHSASFPGLSAEEKQQLDKIMRSIMKQGGVSDSFINRILATPSDDMWYPTYKEMLDAGVVTSKTYGERFASTMGLIKDEEKAKIIKTLEEKEPIFKLMRQVYPKETEQAFNDYFNALRSGKSEGESLSFIKQLGDKAYKHALPSASDESILEVRDAYIQFLEQNINKNSEACIVFMGGANVNYARVMPESDMQSFSKAMLNVINSGHNRSKVPIDKAVAEQDMEILSEMLANENVEDLLLLGNKELWKDNSYKVCRTFLSIFKQTKNLPLDRQANFFRYLMVSD